MLYFKALIVASLLSSTGFARPNKNMQDPPIIPILPAATDISAQSSDRAEADQKERVKNIAYQIENYGPYVHCQSNAYTINQLITDLAHQLGSRIDVTPLTGGCFAIRLPR